MARKTTTVPKITTANGVDISAWEAALGWVRAHAPLGAEALETHGESGGHGGISAGISYGGRWLRVDDELLRNYEVPTSGAEAAKWASKIRNAAQDHGMPREMDSEAGTLLTSYAMMEDAVVALCDKRIEMANG